MTAKPSLFFLQFQSMNFRLQFFQSIFEFPALFQVVQPGHIGDKKFRVAQFNSRTGVCRRRRVGFGFIPCFVSKMNSGNASLAP